MHLRALRCLTNRVINNLLLLNKYLTLNSSLSLSKVFVSHSIPHQTQNIHYGLVKDRRSFNNMSTARLSGKVLDDVLYPNIEPYKTGMLQVKIFKTQKLSRVLLNSLKEVFLDFFC